MGRLPCANYHGQPLGHYVGMFCCKGRISTEVDYCRESACRSAMHQTSLTRSFTGRPSALSHEYTLWYCPDKTLVRIWKGRLDLLLFHRLDRNYHDDRQTGRRVLSRRNISVSLQGFTSTRPHLDELSPRDIGRCMWVFA